MSSPKRPAKPSSAKPKAQTKTGTSRPRMQYAGGYAFSDSEFGPVAVLAKFDCETGNYEFTAWLHDFYDGSGQNKHTSAIDIVEEVVGDAVQLPSYCGEEVEWTVFIAPLPAKEFKQIDVGDVTDDYLSQFRRCKQSTWN